MQVLQIILRRCPYLTSCVILPMVFSAFPALGVASGLALRIKMQTLLLITCQDIQNHWIAR